MTQLATINVAACRNPSKVLLQVGGTGAVKPVSVADLISICVRRERTRNLTT